MWTRCLWLKKSVQQKQSHLLQKQPAACAPHDLPSACVGPPGERRRHQPAENSLLCTGVLYYGDQAGEGEKASTFVSELTSRSDLDTFISSQPDNVLTVGMLYQPFAQSFATQAQHSAAEPVDQIALW